MFFSLHITQNRPAYILRNQAINMYIYRHIQTKPRERHAYMQHERKPIQSVSNVLRCKERKTKIVARTMRNYRARHSAFNPKIRMAHRKHFNSKRYQSIAIETSCVCMALNWAHRSFVCSVAVLYLMIFGMLRGEKTIWTKHSPRPMHIKLRHIFRIQYT